MKLYLFKIILLIVFFTAFNSCTEEIALQQETEFEDVLVIEATITNELKYQEINLSKVFRLDESGPNPETNALVKVIDQNNTVYQFTDNEDGAYISNLPFAAQPNVSYRLEVQTSNGEVYNSTTEVFSNPTNIDNLYAERDFNENGEEGISIYVDTEDPNNSSKHYRYEYEETYKIIAPKHSPLELIILNDDFPIGDEDLVDEEGNPVTILEYLVTVSPRSESKYVCYNTVLSNTIITTDTNDFDEDNIQKFRVRFLNRNNYIISHRYSILVSQYVQSRQAYDYYNTLKEFSISESIFSENQLGFLVGNISPSSNSSKVIGFFDVSPVDSKRLYFNYADLFQNEDLPPYYSNCNDYVLPRLYRFDISIEKFIESDLINLLKKDYQYYTDNDGSIPGFTNTEYFPYFLVTQPCGDCTVLGETKVPDFWEE